MSTGTAPVGEMAGLNCSIAINACEKVGIWQLALGLLAELVECTVTQKTIICSAKISLVIRAANGNW